MFACRWWTDCVEPSPALLAQVRVHERTHSGERPYQCRFCDYRASQSGNMAAHERRHTGEKPYPCPYVRIFVRVDVGGGPCDSFLSCNVA